MTIFFLQLLLKIIASATFHTIIIIIIIAAFIMRTYPSSEDVQGNILLLPRSLDTISRPHLQCTSSTPKGAFLAELPIVACSGKYIHNTSFTSYRVPIYTPGWRAAMWIKCLAEGQKVPGMDGNRTRNPLIQSQGFTLTIYTNIQCACFKYECNYQAKVHCPPSM